MRAGIFLMSAALLIIIPISAYAESVSYSPLRDNQTPLGPFPTISEISQDMKKIAEQGISKIRIFETGESLETILQEAEKNKISVAVGIDLTGNEPQDKKKIQDIVNRSEKYNIDFFIIGNNPIYNGHTTLADLVEYIQYTKSLTDIPVTSENGVDFWQNDSLYGIADFVMVDLFADNTSSPERQIQSIMDRYNTIPQYKPIVVESGWSTVNSTKEMQQSFRSQLIQTGIDVYFFEWADESWKPNPIEKGYGIYEADRKEKTVEEKVLKITVFAKTTIKILDGDKIKSVSTNGPAVIIYHTDNPVLVNVVSVERIPFETAIIPLAYADCIEGVECYDISSDDEFGFTVVAILSVLLIVSVLFAIRKIRTKKINESESKHEIVDVKRYFEPIRSDY